MRKKVVIIGIRRTGISITLMLALLVFPTFLMAQEKGVATDSLVDKKTKHRVIWVADVESRRPLRNVTIQLDRRTEKVQTEWGGRFILKNDSFQTMTLTHPSYLTRVIEQKEGVPDTIFLLPSGQQLAEVLVIGHAPKPAVTAEDVRKYAAENYTPSGSSGVSFDFFDLIDVKGRKHKKRAKKMKEIMEDY
ncbi:MAG: hypothetical protein IKX65_09145 [Prevotella sp.]|nr:hypothetical protein [Prevotella sp.]